jgi:hypothetical protein
MIEVHCPCGETFHAEESQIGKKIRCWKCGAVVPIERPRPAPLSRVEPEPLEARAVGNVKTAAEVVIGFKKRVWSIRITAAVGILAAVVVAIWVISITTVSPNTKHSPASPGRKSPAAAAEPSLVERERPAVPRSTPLLNRNIVPPGKRHRPSSAEASGANAMPPLAGALASSRVVIPPCAVGQEIDRPFTGDSLEDAGAKDPSSDSYLEILNGESEDAAVRLADFSTGKKVRFVYIRAGDTFSITGIDPGMYSVLFESGRDWVPACRGFIRGQDIQEFDKPLEFNVRAQVNDSGVEVFSTQGSITLYTVAHGNAKIHAIDRNRFFRGDQRLTLGR